ncbi:MAG: DNA polymerase IV [Gemmatimonadota bacterium]|nr:MAG: DNA polymerase IV [Gemmatimonadota bacterium]
MSARTTLEGARVAVNAERHVRTILHADMDAFFAAVEAREDPSIADRPIVVGADPRGGRGRGVVAACNYEARKYGIHSAMPISEAYRRCPDAVYLRPRMKLYAEVSERIMAILEGYTELVEKLSIDEAFLDVTASTRLFGDGESIARLIKAAVWEQERLTVSVGVAPNKFLAKLASDLEKPDGLVVVEPGKEREFLHPLPVERLWGVGPKTSGQLHGLGIHTIGDIAEFPLDRLVRHLGHAHASHLIQLANGEDERPVEVGQERKQISRETTFLTDTDDRDYLQRTLLALTEEVAARLRRRGMAARTVTLKLRLAPFDTLTRRKTVDTDLTTTEAIYPIALKLLEAADPGDRSVRLIGVGVSGLHERAPEPQLGLFDEKDKGDNASRVADVMDEVSDKFGRGTLKRGKLIDGGTDDEE